MYYILTFVLGIIVGIAIAEFHNSKAERKAMVDES